MVAGTPRTLYELKAEEGMTWLDWVDSEYNTCGATYQSLTLPNNTQIQQISFMITNISTGGVYIDSNGDGAPDVLEDGAAYELIS